MARNKVVFTEKARKDLGRIPDKEADKILAACLRLQTNIHPDGKHIKKLRGYESLFRLRVGDYRVVFEYGGADATVVRLLTRQDFGKKY